MNKKIKCSLIITTYNWPQALQLVLKSVVKQTILPEEVIIADDGSSEETLHLINKFKESSALNLIHSWQEDKGFRVSRSRNKAISLSSGEYIILIDGDMILHPKFVEDHLSEALVSHFIQGSRVLIKETKSKDVFKEQQIRFNFFCKGIENRKNAIHLSFLSKIFSQKRNYLKSIKTCNMSFYRDDCIKINGFNEDFNGWGREDSEFAVRLMNSGINRKTLKFKANQYHIWHFENTKARLSENDFLLNKSIKNSLTWCQNGIKK